MNIIDILKLSREDKTCGIWLSGTEKEGEYMEWWYDSGGKYIKAFWVNGERKRYKEWYKNGVLREISFWRKRELHGEFKRYHENGVLYEHSFWKGACKKHILMFFVTAQVSG